MENIGFRLKKYINESRKNLKDFAEESKINLSTLSKIINEDKVPSGETLIKLANAGVDLHWVLLGIGDMKLRTVPETTISEIRYFQNKYSFNNTRNDEYDTIIDFFKNDCEFKELLPIDNLLEAENEEGAFLINPLDLRTLVLQNQRTLFFCKIFGSSMSEYGIMNDDIIVLRHSAMNPTNFNSYLTILDRYENDKLIIRKYDKESNQLLSGSKDLAPIPYDPELIVPAKISSIIRPL